jgi:hypothetical protein
LRSCSRIWFEMGNSEIVDDFSCLITGSHWEFPQRSLSAVEQVEQRWCVWEFLVWSLKDNWDRLILKRADWWCWRDQPVESLIMSLLCYGQYVEVIDSDSFKLLLSLCTHTSSSRFRPQEPRISEGNSWKRPQYLKGIRQILTVRTSRISLLRTVVHRIAVMDEITDSQNNLTPEKVCP